MRRLRATALLTVVVLGAAACGSGTPADVAQPAADPSPTAEATEVAAVGTGEGEWTLVWEDTFDGPAGSLPDAEWWTHEIGGDGWGNFERQYYTDDPANGSLDGEGNLVITAIAGPPADGTDCWYGECEYTSARITTRGTVEPEYGRIEVRAQLPEGDGMWPAFWMLGANIDLKGWPNAGEIDIMEHIGKEPRNVYGTVHGPTYSGGDGIGGRYRFPADALPADGFHTYAIEWEPERIRWYMDDEHWGTLMPSLLPSAQRWVFDHPFFLILNLAVGGRWPGDPTEETVFPQEFVIDHVRVLAWETTDG